MLGVSIMFIELLKSLHLHFIFFISQACLNFIGKLIVSIKIRFFLATLVMEMYISFSF
jgi:hypothetical protein